MSTRELASSLRNMSSANEIGGTIGIAALATIATGSAGATTPTGLSHGLGDAFMAAAGMSTVAGVIALIVLPSAAIFLPKLRLAPRVAIH
jgi:hypothetical protein